MICVGGNYYSVPDTTRRRIVDVHALADEIRIFEAGRLLRPMRRWRDGVKSGSILHTASPSTRAAAACAMSP